MALEFRSLDDQTYDGIMEQALSRLPWLCPSWTDHNSHDPGITVLEALAWYKELQQYYLNQVTPAVRRALLRLAGVTPEAPQAALCMVEAEPDSPPRLAGARLVSPQGVPFELPEAIPTLRTRLSALRIWQGDKEYDVAALASGDAVFRPFAFRAGEARKAAPGAESVLLLGFSGKPSGELRLWFDVVEPEGSSRNRPDGESLPPRTIVWEAVSGSQAKRTAMPVSVLRDDTWRLSWSGYMTLSVPADWKPGAEGLYWLSVRQTEPGCEEEVRLTSISANRFPCVQKESRVRRYAFQVSSGFGQEVLIPNAQARYAYLAVFRRRLGGWEQVEQKQIKDAILAEGRLIRLDTEECVQDGKDNLLVVCHDTLTPLLYDLKGLPGERIFLDLENKEVMEMDLLCQTLERDGIVRPALWRRVEDLSVCSPRDFVFRWDSVRQEIVFGDGLHGAIPEAGKGAVMVADLVVSECGGGNLPAGTGLRFTDDGRQVENSAASGGVPGETLEEAGNRLLRRLEDTGKCQSAEDFARCALRTPGARLAGAKALPDYDPAMGMNRRHPGYVSVVVLPASEAARPMPDSRLLAAVDRQLDWSRPVCIQAKAIPPVYVPLSVSVHALVQPGTRREALEAVLRDWLRPRAELAGETLRRTDALALLQKVEGVLQVYRADPHPRGSGGWLTAAGDLRLPPDGLPWLEEADIELKEI